MELAQGSWGWWPSAQFKAHNLLAGDKGNSFGKVVFYDSFYLVENSYAKCALGPMEKYSFLVT